MDTAAALGAELESSRQRLWSICYRMTGSGADADDLVQETFARALERPPPDRTLPLRPWLVTVAVNLARDSLRRRKVREYRGPWLPEPIVVDASMLEAAQPEAPSAECRYATFESLSYAFLVALEELTPTARAVLLLRDALDYSVTETAIALGLSEANVKTSLHRARAVMASYDAQRRPLTAELNAEVAQVLSQLLTAMSLGDAAQFEALLASDVRATSDGGGRAFAAREPVTGAARIARMYRRLAQGASEQAKIELVEINGLPAVLVEDAGIKPPAAPRAMFRIELSAAGLIQSIHSLVNPDKLERLFQSRIRAASQRSTQG